MRRTSGRSSTRAAKRINFIDKADAYHNGRHSRSGRAIASSGGGIWLTKWQTRPAIAPMIAVIPEVGLPAVESQSQPPRNRRQEEAFSISITRITPPARRDGRASPICCDQDDPYLGVLKFSGQERVAETGGLRSGRNRSPGRKPTYYNMLPEAEVEHLPMCAHTGVGWHPPHTVRSLEEC